MTKLIPRHRMKTHEMNDYGRVVNACFEDDVCKLEKRIKELEKERDVLKKENERLKKQLVFPECAGCKSLIIDECGVFETKGGTVCRACWEGKLRRGE